MELPPVSNVSDRLFFVRGFMDENEELVAAKLSKITNPTLLSLLFGENLPEGNNLSANLKAYFCRPFLAEIK